MIEEDRDDRRRWWRHPGARVGAMSAVLALAAVAAQVAWLRGGLPPIRPELVRLLAVGVLFAVAEKFLVTFPVRRGSHSISLSEIPLVLGLAGIDPALITPVRVLGAVVGLVAFRRQRGSRLVFNLALYATEVSVACAVFHSVVGPSADPLGPVGWAAVFAATFATNVLSMILVTAAISMHDDAGEWRRLLTADIKDDLQLPLFAVTTCLGLVTALVVRQDVRAALLLGVLSYAAYQAFRRYAQQSHGHAQVEDLYGFTRALDGSRDTDDVTRIVLSRVRDLVRAQSAELIVRADDGRPIIRIRMVGQEEVHTDVDPPQPAWWQSARSGVPVILAASRQRPTRDGEPLDGMAVPVSLGDAGTGVLVVTDSLPDVPTFTEDHLRLLQALANHAGVALTNVHLVDRLSHLALHDTLTGLPNRRQFLTDVQRAVAAQPAEGGAVAIVLMDLDRFKEVNDALGHDLGDDLLREVGNRLQARLGARGTVARLGGDEFAVLVPHAPSAEAILAVASDLRQAVDQPVPVGSLALTAQASVGIAFAPEHGNDANRLLQRADVAMYAAKQSHTGIRVYQPDDDKNTPRRLALLGDLRDAIERNELEVVFQPKVDPRSDTVRGAEALARWRHTDGPVPPDEFIPLAERSGLIRPLTLRVLHTALTHRAQWRRTGQDLPVAVNLSPHILTDHSLIADIERLLHQTGVPADALTLEITENGVMHDPARSLVTLRALHALGVKLSIDDFGTGHSSLGRLAELPIHEVKIDKRFIQGLTFDRHRRAVTDAALQLGRALDLTVVAEGVEDPTEYDYLRRQGCDVVQGYYVARPLPPDEFMTWLTRRTAAAGTPDSAELAG